MLAMKAILFILALNIAQFTTRVTAKDDCLHDDLRPTQRNFGGSLQIKDHEKLALEQELDKQS